MKLLSLLLITLISYTSARPTFDKIAEVLLNVLTEDQPRHIYQHPPNHHAGYGQGYHQQYHYGGGESGGYSHGTVGGGYANNNGYYRQPAGNVRPINPGYNTGYDPQYQSGPYYPNGNYGSNDGYYGQPLQQPPYVQHGYQSNGY